MGTSLRRISSALIFALAACTTQVDAPDETAARTAVAAVELAEGAFAREADARGIVPAFRMYVAPNAIMFLPTPVVVNPMLETANWPGDIDWRPAFAAASAAGDVVVTAGPSVWKTSASTDLGYYFTVWSRQPDGAFRFVVDGSAVMAENLYAAPATPTDVLVADRAPGAPAADIVALERAFAADAQRDAHAALVERMAAGGRVLRAGLAPGTGPLGARTMLGAGGQGVSYTHEGGGAAAGGDLAWSYGRLAWVSGGRSKQGVYFRTWIAQGDQWRIALDQMAELKPQ